MRAVTTSWYGSETVLAVKELPVPACTPDRVLVKVHAASINPVDCKIRSGKLAMVTGVSPPKILGADFSGTVEALGTDVQGYKPGDRVWGKVNSFKGGTYAQFVSVKQDELSLMPNNLSFEEAASLPNVSLTAYQALVEFGRAKEGQKVLINGCSGGVGIAALQIARAQGCEVTAVCSQQNAAVVRKFGASRVIDYQKEKIDRHIGSFDIIFDCVASLSFVGTLSALKSGGKYISTLPSLVNSLVNPFARLTQDKSAKSIMVQPSHSQLLILKELVERGKLNPLIEQTFPLEKIGQAHARSQSGRVVGKLVVSIQHNPPQ